MSGRRTSWKRTRRKQQKLGRSYGREGSLFQSGLPRALRKEAENMVIPPGARLAWSDAENKMIWVAPEQP